MAEPTHGFSLDAIGGRQESILGPGELRVPENPPEELPDWTRGDSQLFMQPRSSGELDSQPMVLNWGIGTAAVVPSILHTGEGETKQTTPPLAAGQMTVTEGTAPSMMPQHPNAAESLPAPTSGVQQMMRSASQLESDQMYFQAKTFPPPPPPKVPSHARRNRAELWYYHANKWDPTSQLPPPPRSPLQEMEQEYNLNLPPMSRAPYRGEDWLKNCDYWFSYIHANFRSSETSFALKIPAEAVLSNCVTE